MVGVFSYQSLKSRTETAGLLTTTLRVREELERLLSSVKDAETGQRGFLLTGDEGYLAPYSAARAEVPAEFALLRSMIRDTEQLKRLAEAENLINQKLAELDETIELRRNTGMIAALEVVRSDRGRAAMDQIRDFIAEMKAAQEVVLERRQSAWQAASELSMLISLGGLGLLLVLIGVASVVTSRYFRASEVQTWLRRGQAGLAERVQGDQRLDVLGGNVLAFLSEFMDAQVGAMYITEGGRRFRRFASHALPPSKAESDTVGVGEGLLGQAVKDNRVLHVRDVPAGYLPVASALGEGTPHELAVLPASVDGVVHAAIELGFFRKLMAADLELLGRVSELIAIAARASKDRTRLEELLEETQRQGEELQSQQEELRVSNEELEVQARALKQSQTNLEAQQAELQQINSQLEEQTQELEAQRDDLSRSQAVLNDKAAELERANQYKSEFLANMSHELRTPLNSSLILAKILSDNKQGNLSAEQVKFANTILSAGNELLAIINDVLDLSKIEAGKVDLEVGSIIVSRSVDELIKGLQPVAQQKKLELSAAIEPGVPERLETDGQRLGQILKNLLSNALKFTERGSVSLRVFAVGTDKVAFSVQDTGIGIPAQQQEIIFEAFRQADGSTHRRYGGTGLGLSISRDLAHLLGGQVSVQSVPNEGSTFTLTLPVRYAAPAETTAATITTTPTRTHGRTPQRLAPELSKPPATPRPAEVEDDRENLTPGGRLILIVEDDVRFASILRDLTREMGFQCIVTHSANDALSAAYKYRPSAVVLDINLPDHSGLGVLDQLKHNSDTRHIPVHIASVADFSQEALELGAIGYILKPVKREQLVEALQRLEAKFSQSLRRVLVVEDDARQLDSVKQLLANEDVEITGVATAGEALARLKTTTFDCMVMDLNLPDLSGYELLEKMAEEDAVSFPPVIIYTGRTLSRDEEQRLLRYSKTIIIKNARSPERLLDEVTLFLHQVESKLPAERQRMLKVARDREATFEGRRILVVEDDVRNIFALTSLLEPKGAQIEIARNGREALEFLAQRSPAGTNAVDLVLMDIMMPEMDGFTAMREIRKQPQWKKLPIIALTAKAMRDDQEKCLAAGANDYIAKPLDVEKLLSLVRVWMPK
jgi:CheY-like chemotaxis protein/CHASE3 domain sensor protein